MIDEKNLIKDYVQLDKWDDGVIILLPIKTSVMLRE